MVCKNCKGTVDKKAVVCVHCGCKIKKPIYKKWWFWAIIVVIAIAVASGSGENNTGGVEESTEANVEISYEAVDLGVMIDDLKNNAMKAESKYQDKYVEFVAKIKNFDSDGKYISVEPKNADAWNFDTAMCYIKNDDQKAFLMEKSIGDTVTIKGKVKSIGEVLGYSIDIAEIG